MNVVKKVITMIATMATIANVSAQSLDEFLELTQTNYKKPRIRYIHNVDGHHHFFSEIEPDYHFIRYTKMFKGKVHPALVLKKTKDDFDIEVGFRDYGFGKKFKADYSWFEITKGKQYNATLFLHYALKNNFKGHKIEYLFSKNLTTKSNYQELQYQFPLGKHWLIYRKEQKNHMIGVKMDL